MDGRMSVEKIRANHGHFGAKKQALYGREYGREGVIAAFLQQKCVNTTNTTIAYSHRLTDAFGYTC